MNARPATTGSSPSPIVSAPAACSPSTIIRCFSNSVEISHSCEWLRITALTTITTPASSTSQPVQSHALQPLRQRRARSPLHAKTSAATANVAGITASSPRTNGATSAATTAAAIQLRRPVASAFTIRKKQSAE